MLEWLRQIIPDAKSFEIVAQALIGGLVLLLGAREAAKMKKKPPRGDTVEIAGAIVDNTMTRALVAAVEANTKALDSRMAALHGLASQLTALKEEVSESNRRLEQIKDELIKHYR